MILLIQNFDASGKFTDIGRTNLTNIGRECNSGNVGIGVWATNPFSWMA